MLGNVVSIISPLNDLQEISIFPFLLQISGIGSIFYIGAHHFTLHNITPYITKGGQ